MADLSKIKLNGITYDLKDATAREALEAIPNITVFESNLPFSSGYFENDAEYKPGLRGPYNEDLGLYENDYYTCGEIYDAIANGVVILYLNGIYDDRWSINRAYIASSFSTNIYFTDIDYNYFSFAVDADNRNNDAVFIYHTRQQNPDILYINLIQTDNGYETEDGYTYAQLKSIADNANTNNQVVCLRYNDQLWYLTNSKQIDEVVVGTAIVGTSILSE